jgi:hypothetical protein
VEQPGDCLVCAVFARQGSSGFQPRGFQLGSSSYRARRVLATCNCDPLVKKLAYRQANFDMEELLSTQITFWV